MQQEMGTTPVRLTTGHGQHLAVRSLTVELVIDGPMCFSDLHITFANDLDRTVEGDLVFPLSPFAALTELTVAVGARKLRGKFRPRERAQAEYRRAVQAGQTAALGEGEGEDLARLHIAPIEAGEDVAITLGVVHPLIPTADGHRLLLPLTYMPRYVESPAALNATEAAAVERPRPLTLAARAQVKISIRKGSTPIAVRFPSLANQPPITDGPGLLEVSLRDLPLDRDLQLEITDRPTGAQPAVWLRHDPTPGPDGLGPTTAVGLIPPAFADEGPTVARTVTLLVDRSGSMSGSPLASAQRAVRGCLRALGPADTFNIVAFSDSLEALAGRPLPLTEQWLSRADQFADALDASGGTEASRALVAVLADQIGDRQARLAYRDAPAPDSRHRLRIVVMLTDGDVGTAAGVLASAKDRLVDTRLFVIGIGESVNHAMLAQLATLGGGTYTPVATNEDLERALQSLKNAIDAPILTGVTVELESGGDVTMPAKLEPAGALDLFAGQPLLLAFRGPLPAHAQLVVKAQTAAGDDYRVRVPMRAPSATASGETDADTASLLWALLRNRRLTYQFDSNDNATLEALGTTFGLVNRRVALVGVHSDVRQTAAPETVPVVLPLPANLAQDPAAEEESASTRTGSLTRSGAVPAGLRMPAPPSPARSAPMASAAAVLPPSAPMLGSYSAPHLGSAPSVVDQLSDDDDQMLGEPMMDAGIAPPKPSPAKAKKSVLRRISSLFSKQDSDAESEESDAPAAPIPAAEMAAPPPPPAMAPPPPSRVVAAPPRAMSAGAAPTASRAATSSPRDSEKGRAGSAATGGRFSNDSAGLRLLLLEQRADGLFGDLESTAMAVAVLVSRGHTVRAGNFRAELRRTGAALQARLPTEQGRNQLLCALALALLRMPHGESAPGELTADLAARLQGRTLNDLPALAAAIRDLARQPPLADCQSDLCIELQLTFLP